MKERFLLSMSEIQITLSCIRRELGLILRFGKIESEASFQALKCLQQIRSQCESADLEISKLKNDFELELTRLENEICELKSKEFKLARLAELRKEIAEIERSLNV